MREYCCCSCGLIWFGEVNQFGLVECPECNSDNLRGLIYACDTTKYAYVHDQIVEYLDSVGKKIHYHKDHPLHSKVERGRLL